MGLKKIFKKNWIKSECYFYQNQKCILGKKPCLSCFSFILKIDNISNPKEYIEIVNEQNNNRINRMFSLMGLLISIVSLLISFIVMRTTIK